MKINYSLICFIFVDFYTIHWTQIQPTSIATINAHVILTQVLQKTKTEVLASESFVNFCIQRTAFL